MSTIRHAVLLGPPAALAVGGRTLAEHALQRLARAGIETVMLPDGVPLGAAGLRLAPAPPGPCFVIDPGIFWLDGPAPTLDRLAAAYAAEATDAAILVHRSFQIRTETGPGDYHLDQRGVVRRREERAVAPYVDAGIRLIDAALLGQASAEWEPALAAGRVRGVVHDGLWFRLRDAGDVADAEAVLLDQTTGETR